MEVEAEEETLVETGVGAMTEVETEMAIEAEMDMDTSTTGTTALYQCKRVAELIQTDFQEVHLSEEYTWQAVVIITKGGGDYRGIELVEMAWNVVMVILNLCLTTSIAFHEILYGFWPSYGTSTAYLKAKLLYQLMAMREEVLYAIFLELNKAYDDLDRERFLGILEGYVVGPLDHCILGTY